MSIRGMLRAAVLLLLIRTWLAEGNDPPVPPSIIPTVPPMLNLDLLYSVPKLVLNLFDCENCANGTVVHSIVERVLSNYDDRVRPNFGGDPVHVGISMYVSRIDKVTEKNMDYTISMFFHQTWNDPRLAYNETNQNLTLDYGLLEKLWVPDCYFVNSKEKFMRDMTVQNRVFQLQPDGTVHYGIRLTTTASCAMNPEKFPMDKQTCNLVVESYGYTSDDVELYWESNDNDVKGNEKLDIPQFSFLRKNVLTKEVPLYTGDYMQLTLRFQIQREARSYLFYIYWPMLLITIASWVSFWMNYESSAARVTVGLTSMLVLNTINSHLREKLPNVSCVKAIDIYMMVCFFFIFLSLVEYVYINFFFYSRRAKRLGRHARRRQRLMRLRMRLRRQARRLMARYQYEQVLMQLFARWWHEEVMAEEEAYDGQSPAEQENQAYGGQLPAEPEDHPCPPPSPAVLVHTRDDSRGFLPLPDVCSVGDRIHFEDEVNPVPQEPIIQATLATPEHCSSLSSFSLRAPLAQAESFSSLSSLSSDETLSDLPDTSEQALQVLGSEGDALEMEDEITPIDSCDSSEYEDCEEDEDDQVHEEPTYADANSTSNESQGPENMQMVLSRRHVQGGNINMEDVFDLCESVERLHRLPEDVRMESGYLGLREECRQALVAAASYHDVEEEEEEEEEEPYEEEEDDYYYYDYGDDYDNYDNYDDNYDDYDDSYDDNYDDNYDDGDNNNYHDNNDDDDYDDDEYYDADDDINSDANADDPEADGDAAADADDEDESQDERESTGGESYDHDSSDSEDSEPPSPTCSFKKAFSSKLFRPTYIPMLDRCSRVLFPLAFLVFNIIYWAYHMY